MREQESPSHAARAALCVRSNSVVMIHFESQIVLLAAAGDDITTPDAARFADARLDPENSSAIYRVVRRNCCDVSCCRMLSSAAERVIPDRIRLVVASDAMSPLDEDR